VLGEGLTSLANQLIDSWHLTLFPIGFEKTSAEYIKKHIFAQVAFLRQKSGEKSPVTAKISRENDKSSL
jgi:hypothetical protein